MTYPPRTYIGNKIAGQYRIEKILNYYTKQIICSPFGYEKDDKPIILEKAGGWYSCKLSEDECSKIKKWLALHNSGYDAMRVSIETLGLGLIRKKIFISLKAESIFNSDKIDEITD